jgi:hypothetical protein
MSTLVLIVRRIVGLVVPLMFVIASPANAQRYDPEESAVWQQLKQTVFKQRPINASANCRLGNSA